MKCFGGVDVASEPQSLSTAIQARPGKSARLSVDRHAWRSSQTRTGSDSPWRPAPSPLARLIASSRACRQESLGSDRRGPSRPSQTNSGLAWCEYLSAAGRNLPQGIVPTLGPDATGVGWVYQYAVMAKKRSLAELRTTQDWQVRFAVAKAEGVAEVASVGGFVRQYSIVVDPRRLRLRHLVDPGRHGRERRAQANRQ